MELSLPIATAGAVIGFTIPTLECGVAAVDTLSILLEMASRTEDTSLMIYVELSLSRRQSQWADPMTDPIFLYVDPVGACGLKCPTCARGRGDLPVTAEIPVPLFRDIIHKANIEVRLDGVGLYNWGEPLLHRNLHLLIQTLKNHGIPSEVSTTLNGELSRLTHILPDHVIVSLSGWSQNVYEIGHRGGDIEQVKFNLARLVYVGRNKTRITLAWHRYPHNQHEEKEACEYARFYGLRWAPTEALALNVDWMIAAVDGGMAPHPVALLRDPLQAVRQSRRPWQCLKQRYQCAVDAQGYVYECCGTRSKPLGKFMDLTWQEIKTLTYASPTCDACFRTNTVGYFQPSNLGTRLYGNPIYRWLKRRLSI